MKKFILPLFFLLFFPKTILAADLNIDCQSSPQECSSVQGSKLFDLSDGLWYPGRVVIKTINIKNSSNQTKEIGARGKSTNNNLSDIFNLNISPENSTTVIWSGSLSQFYSKDYISLGIFDPEKDLNYSFSLRMDSQADNNSQNILSSFDLVLGFWEQESKTDHEEILNPGISVPQCHDEKPGLPVLLDAVATNKNSIKLVWSKAKDPVTYYLIAYGTKPNLMEYGNPNVGGSDTTSYTVNHISGNTKYYFRVRAGNGCMPGDFSNEIAVSPKGEKLEGQAENFYPNILSSTFVSSIPSNEIHKQKYKIDQKILFLIPGLVAFVFLVKFLLGIIQKAHKKNF